MTVINQNEGDQDCVEDRSSYIYPALRIHYDLEQYASLAIAASNSFSVFNRIQVPNLAAMILNAAQGKWVSSSSQGQMFIEMTSIQYLK